MKVTALIPYWLDYQKNDIGIHKNLKKLGGKYLINYSIKLLNSISNIHETVVFCSDDKIKNYIDDNLAYEFVQRDKLLDNDNVSIDEVIKSYLDTTDTDIVVLLHPNSPFLTSNTVNECLSKVLSKEYDSAFTAYYFNKLSWYKGKPLNYSLDYPTPQTTELNPVVIEQSSLYVFSRESFNLYNKRIGKTPYIWNINHFEGLEVSSQEDFEIAELIVNSGMYPKVI